MELRINGKSAGTRRNGEYRLPDAVIRSSVDTPPSTTPGIAVSNVFFWNAELRPGRNLVEIEDERGLRASMIVYQTNPDGTVPPSPDSLLTELRSSNPANPAILIERPIQAQTPFYSAVDGHSDNTFDAIPSELAGACWISTLRPSEADNATELSFTLHRDAIVSVALPTGTYPQVTLKPADESLVAAFKQQAERLAALGFVRSPQPFVWRDHALNLSEGAIWSKSAKAGEKLSLPAAALDSLVLLKAASLR